MSNDLPYRILHIADPHFGYCHFSEGTPEEIGEKHADELIDVLDKHKKKLYPRPFDCIVLSGDFTFQCGPDGFKAAAAFLEKIAVLSLRGRVVILPGNHDVTLVNPITIKKLYLPDSKEEAEAPFRAFLDNIRRYAPGTSEWLTSSDYVRRPGLPGLYIEGLNSCRVERTDARGWGFIGTDQLYQLGDKLIRGSEEDEEGWEPPRAGDIVIAVTHHNPLPLWDLGLEEIRNPPGKRKLSFMMDAADLLRFLSEFGVMILLHGHAHTKSVKVVEGYSRAGVPQFSPTWVMGAGSFSIQKREKREPHHFQVLEIDAGSYGCPELKYQDVVSFGGALNEDRDWNPVDPPGIVALTSTWDPKSAANGLQLRQYEKSLIGWLMEVADSWAVLRTKVLRPAGWPGVLAGICNRTLAGARALGITNLTAADIVKILDDIFENPPSDYRICNFRLEQIILDRWINP